MLISQVANTDGSIIVVVREDGGTGRAVKGATSVYALAMEAADSGRTLRAVIDSMGLGEEIDLSKAYSDCRMLSPITHPDAAHMHLTGTGLTHLGSAAARDSMHKKQTAASEETLTDSMKMFRMGLESGKSKPGEKGVQPEWFYKGNGTQAVAPGSPLTSPSFALDGGEEPEIAGIYVISSDGSPFRIGFAVSNEFSDHVTERINYLYLAHSKLRQASFGPEIRVGEAPEDIRGHSRIIRGGQILGEAVPVWRAKYVPQPRQSRISSLQVWPVPQSRRRPCPHVWDRDPFVRRWNSHTGRRCIRNRRSRVRVAATKYAKHCGRRGDRDRSIVSDVIVTDELLQLLKPNQRVHGETEMHAVEIRAGEKGSGGGEWGKLPVRPCWAMATGTP